MSFDMFSYYPLSWQPNKKKLKRPVYKSLVEQMRQDINNGKLLPGTKLPPQRELAYFLDVNFTTITRAYKLSQHQGLTYGVVGKGTYISQSVNTSITITRNQSVNIKELGFLASFEASNKFLKPTIANVTNQKNIVNLLNYEEPTGIGKHKMIATRYMNKIGMNVNQQNTMIVSGGLNALTIALMGLFKSGDKIAVDQFTYANFIELARLKDLTLIPIMSDEYGMRADLLRQACKNNNIKGIYLMPDFCNPTTIVISTERRYDLAQIIKKEQLVLIEDDYLNFLNLFKTKPLIKISSIVPEQSIYICSMSKPLVSGLRVAFIRVADQFKEQIEISMFNVDIKTSSLDADIVTRALENGASDMILQYKLSCASHANQIYDKIFYPKSKLEQKMHFFRCLPVSSQLNGSQIEKICMDKHIRVFHSDRFLVGPHSQRAFLRISLASIDNFEELENSLRQLKQILLESELIKKRSNEK